MHPNKLKISLLKIEISKLEEQLSNEQREARKLLKPEYTYEVYVEVQKKSVWHSDIVEGQEFIRIRRTLSNSQVFKYHMNHFGSINNPPRDSDLSVNYYRKHGILFHDGGGHLILNDKELCSDSDWEDLKNGKLDNYLASPSLSISSLTQKELTNDDFAHRR